jgi:hypothetical protein
MRQPVQHLSRRALLAALAVAGKKVLVAGHPWVYAARRSNNDIYEILDQIFADMRAAGLDAIELMHTALEPEDAVARIGELSKRRCSARLSAPTCGIARSTTPSWRGHGW